MTKDDVYYFHQTPEELCKELIKKLEIEEGDTILEPFKGEGGFYNNFPDKTIKYYTEIEEGLDYKTFDKNIDWVISNPPFKLNNKSIKDSKINSFYSLLEYYSTRVNKGIAFLGNDYCFSTLNPRRIKKLEDNGLYLHKVIVCNVKKWRGRYFFLIFKKNKQHYDHKR
jgi:hypothetical protein